MKTVIVYALVLVALVHVHVTRGLPTRAKHTFKVHDVKPYKRLSRTSRNIEEEETDETQSCKDRGSIKMNDCNICICDGSEWACTKISCSDARAEVEGSKGAEELRTGQWQFFEPGSNAPLNCVPDSNFVDECGNACTCDSDGLMMACTLMDCDPDDRVTGDDFISYEDW